MNKYNIFRRYFSIICIASCLHSCIWGAGSYSDAEVYLISLPSSDNLIDSIIKMKHKYPQMSAFHKNENDDIISMDHWSINFYTSYFIIDKGDHGDRSVPVIFANTPLLDKGRSALTFTLFSFIVGYKTIINTIKK